LVGPPQKSRAPDFYSLAYSTPINMKYHALSAIISLFILTLIFACENATTYEEALDYNRQNIKEPGKVGDADFLVKAKSLTTLQTSLLQLCQEKGYSSATVNLGKANVELFKTLESDITELAGKEDIRLASTMDPAHLQLFEEIHGTDRGSFDQKIVFSLRSVNEQELKLFEEQATKAFDPDVRAFAARTLGQVKSYGETIGKVQAELLPMQGK
jgi:putative membrane protein